MPYIVKENRAKFIAIIDEVESAFLFDKVEAGELNYILTEIIIRFLKRNGGFRYKDINDAIGALECCKQELYRRLVAPYEDKKIKENGDVFFQ